MPAATTITTTTEGRAPLGWWRGWLVTMGVGVTLSAFIGVFGNNAIGGLVDGDPHQVLMSVLRAVPGTFVFWPFALVVGIVPITLAYAGLRWAAPARMSLPLRFVVGAVLGAVACGMMLLADPLTDPSTGEHGLLVAAPTFFPFIEIEASAIVLALVARPRWFGVP